MARSTETIASARRFDGGEQTPSVAMLLTPPGGAAIAVLRLTGPLVGPLLAAHFSGPIDVCRCAYGELHETGPDGRRVIDDAIVVLLPGSAGADVNLHGGPWVVQSALDLIRRIGFEVVEPSPLPIPEAALDGGGALEREVLAHLPLARTSLALQRLLAQPQAWDELSRRHDAGADLHGERQAMLADRSLHWLLNPPRVAIAGAPNVGKSTLANQLFAQERSITADVAGTTRDWVGEIANVDGLAVMLLDTPGIRRTGDAIEAAAIECSGGELAASDLIVLVLDATRSLEDGQADLLMRFPEALVVINKVDRPSAWELGRVEGLRCVAKDGMGVDALRREVCRRFGIFVREPSAARCWTERQWEIITQGQTWSLK